MAEHVHHHAVLSHGHGSADDQYLETPPGSTYEHTDAHVGPMVKFAIWLVISAVIVHVGLAAMYWLLVRESTERVDTQRYPLAVNTPTRLPAAPRLQQFPRNELYTFRNEERDRLQTYGWESKAAGTVHIPIEEAMKLMVERGLPAQGTDAAQPAVVGMMPADSSSGRTLEKRRQ